MTDSVDADWAHELPEDLRARLPELATAYFRHTSAGEPDGVLDEHTDAILREHLALARHRLPGRSVTRVHRPGDGTGVGAALQVVTDDMPLIVESVTALLSRLEASIGEVIHPILGVLRDDDGSLLEIFPDVPARALPEGTVTESWMHVQLHPATEDSVLDALESAIVHVLSDVGQVVADTEAMRALQRTLAAELDVLQGDPPPGRSADELRDCADLLRWLADGHFTVLGYRRYDCGAGPARPVPDSGLGVLRSGSLADEHIEIPLAADIPDRPLLVLTQGSAPATVHRSVYPYFVGVSILGDDGSIVGEHRFLGVFTVTALHENVLDIPVIERRVRTAIARAGFDLDSFSGQAMLEVVQSFPRTELFSIDTDTLVGTMTAVLNIGLRRQVRLFMREDTFGRFVSCLVYLPRDRYTTRVRLAMQQILHDELGGGAVEYTARVTEGDLAMLHVTIRRPAGGSEAPIDTSEANRLRIQGLLAAASRSWDDHLADAVASDPAVDPAQATQYAAVLPESYKEDFGPQRALADIARLDTLQEDSIDLRLYRDESAPAGQWQFALYFAGEGISLSHVLPVLHSLGVEVLDERPYQVVRPDSVRCWIYDFGLAVPAELLRDVAPDLHAGVPDEALRDRFTDAFTAIWHGRAEADRFNELVLRAGLDWRQVSVLRAYVKYLRQAGFSYSQVHIESVVLAHPEIACRLIELFEAQFDPDLAGDGDGERRRHDLEHTLRTAIGAVVSLDVDRILRALFGLVRATLRTNRYVQGDGGAPRGFLSLKFDPTHISELPKPRPRFEVFVYSPDVEGVHLRFGPVARGGLRWSDRREDFRTEILGLAKAQAVKNAVIVPVGAKGGFVVKQPVPPTGDPAVDRQAVRDQGVACYRTFISGLLDVTDNVDRASGAVVPPPRDVRRDGDDTYLVVAADKGTATFSDIANEVAAGYGFWLGDAFASGGSAGYDHKEMGITARGAWESVKRHFRELEIDVAADDFTVVGIGDMSGDVFGNGMLLSEHIRLVAAFDHRHVFLDPDPDAARSFAERRRMFALPRSSWADYDSSLISEGGGVYARTAKSIPVSAQVRAALGLDGDVTEMAPPDLVKAILTAPVDLLWNGGIGTYVKASTESDAAVGDKSNDAVRVHGADLRARVVGEGGNLGVTQLGRIEYALRGGKINTDAIDNSAGVDCSDHEVNIKILLDSLVSNGELASQDRDPLLASMTDEVARLVLADNISQNDQLGMSRASAPQFLEVHKRLIASLVAHHGLDRKLEALPSEAEFGRRAQAGIGLTSPELATVMAHVKLALEQDLHATELPDNEFFAARLPDYFPAQLRARFRSSIRAHPLRREIVATMLANEAIDNGGITYVYRLAEDAGASSTDAIRAYAAVTEIFELRDVWERVRTADMPTDMSDELMLQSRRVLDRASRWFLSNRPQPIAVGAEISRYSASFRKLAPQVPGWLRGHHVTDLDARSRSAIADGAPRELALEVYRLLDLFCLLDIIDIADIAERDGEEVAELYFALDAHLGIDWLLTAVSDLARGDRWHALARLALRDDLYGSLRSLTLEVLTGGEPTESPQEKIAYWESTNASRLARARSALGEIFESGTLDLATLSVAARQVRSMVRGVGTRSEVGR
ncbi:NAD-glutamate dehydrogenase [Rhodococcus sp. SGAir0479]|uniref:NAD-glutamate dehydrogenase n=1 Tax=Rhodococcus sp. SGAir0479 TaxID=2567884 RepID=UPI0010CD2F39|nr:NAD-glutamate dehydrogenase [Rhodococcus sp. SGAir0479]QCQ91708.1 NAD-glutamate dehydrogenase [Rhodococcus sp. SGAir0479]